MAELLTLFSERRWLPVSYENGVWGICLGGGLAKSKCTLGDDKYAPCWVLFYQTGPLQALCALVLKTQSVSVKQNWQSTPLSTERLLGVCTSQSQSSCRLYVLVSLLQRALGLGFVYSAGQASVFSQLFFHLRWMSFLTLNMTIALE